MMNKNTNILKRIKFSFKRFICSKRYSEPIKLELGAGGRKRPGWLAVDIAGDPHIICDLSKEPLPFADNTVSEICSTHFFEHLSYPSPMLDVLHECKRVLKKGGRMRVAVPDASIYIRAYMEHAPFPEVIPVYKPAFHYNTPIDSINYIAYLAKEHKHMFDQENLLKILEVAGFVNVRSREFDPEVDEIKRKPQSVFAEAYKG